MCGIYGFTIDSKENRDENSYYLKQMGTVLVHRGPDSSGVHIDHDIALGYKRLSIIDLKSGDQPMSNEDGSIVLVFNGEIFNYQRLRSSLEQTGHRFRTESDTEVIIHAYEEYGKKCVDNLRGMFGFAIWDKNKRELFLARDRLGIKPFYYSITESGRFIFASQIKSILQHHEIQRSMDLEAIDQYFNFRYIPAPLTGFTGIKKLLPGYALSYKNGKLRAWQYWDVAKDKKLEALSIDEATVAVEKLLIESVKLRLASHVPVGALLSGGIDSSLVVALMSQFFDGRLPTFTVGYKDYEKCDETYYAELIANRYRTNHHNVVVSYEDYRKYLDELTWHSDEPVADPSSPAMFLVSKYAKEQGVTVLLTGEGGDELFAGYGRHLGEEIAKYYLKLPYVIRKLLRTLGNKIPRSRMFKRGLECMLYEDDVLRFLAWHSVFSFEGKARLLNDDFKHDTNESSSMKLIKKYIDKLDINNPLNKLLYLDLKIWLPDDLLSKGDKMTMAASVEGRVPFLDHIFVNFVWSLPEQYKLRFFRTKYLLKKVAKKYLPNEIIKRKKAGFPVPLRNWFRYELSRYVKEIILDDSVKRIGVFNMDFLEKILSDHENKKQDNELLIYTVLVFSIWYNVHFGR